MRAIRSVGQNVSPSDDGRLFDQIFTDGLFEDATFANLGMNNVAISAMYGIICGRDFTCEAQTIQVALPEDSESATGYIYLEIDTSSDDAFTINSALAPFTPVYEDINTNGAIVQMVIATYVANSVAVTSITPVYQLASAGSVLPGSVATLEADQAVSNHAVGEFILLHGQLYKVTSAITAGQSIAPGTNVTATNTGSELTQLNSNLNEQTVYTVSQLTEVSSKLTIVDFSLVERHETVSCACRFHASADFASNETLFKLPCSRPRSVLTVYGANSAGMYSVAFGTNGLVVSQAYPSVVKQGNWGSIQFTFTK